MTLLAGATLLLLVWVLYVAAYFRWEHRSTRGMAYYGLSLAGRRALKRKIRLYSLPVRPIARLIAVATRRHLTMPLFEYEGVTGPKGTSSPELFARATRYEPRPQDVFVATQMRCGTTWMQQLVYEVLTRGRGDLTDRGHGHLYAMSPWIEAMTSVRVEDAPLVGDPPARIIKTHLPASLCPYSPGSKYIYVTRHPVSCFASIVDFSRSTLGPLLPPLSTMTDWYCSDRMYWLPWPRHVDGWWRWSRERSNVLFVHFEEMKRGLGAVRDRVAHFLGCDLTAVERERVDERCSFRYMKDHEELFEMAPPTLFSVIGGKFLASGSEQRHEDVTPEIRQRIARYCREALRHGAYPAGEFYRDLG